ncbi:hypothetical protein EDB83DRAFT_1955324 [Lactarius deliciosus]|nr:hypothetical protein EDB83DRAFT_1955324 [Lactarius deliciosus]
MRKPPSATKHSPSLFIPLSGNTSSSSTLFNPQTMTLDCLPKSLPQNIEVRASDKESGTGVMVGDVLKAIDVDLRKPSSQRQWAALNEDIRSQVEYAFLDRAKTGDAICGGILRIDYLRGKNRLQVFPRHPYPEEDEEITQPLLPINRPIDMLEVAGPTSSSSPLRAPYRGNGRVV